MMEMPSRSTKSTSPVMPTSWFSFVYPKSVPSSFRAMSMTASAFSGVRIISSSISLLMRVTTASRRRVPGAQLFVCYMYIRMSKPVSVARPSGSV